MADDIDKNEGQNDGDQKKVKEGQEALDHGTLQELFLEFQWQDN